MDISSKVLTWGTGGAVLGGLALLSLQSLLILPYLDQLEIRVAEAKASQVTNLFEAEAGALALTVEDWATWDDSDRFLRGTSPEFADENLYPSAFEAIHVNAMVFFAADGRALWSRQLSPDRRTFVPLAPAPYAATLDKLGPKQSAEGRQGYLRTPDGLVLVALRAVTPSAGGLPSGTLVMIRRLESSFWASVEKRLGLAYVPLSPGAGLSLGRGTLITRSSDRKTTLLRVPLADLTNELNLELQATLSRDLTQTGLGLLGQVIWGSIGILALTTLVNLLLIRRYLVRPVKDLWRLTREVEATRNWTLRGTPRSHDEVGELTRSVNTLVQSVQETTERLKELAATDPLTGLANRRSFDQALNQAWRLSQREKLPLSVVLGDVDKFKQFNDTRGHLAGDACLKSVADILRRCAVRPADVNARYGGEEFAVVLPYTDAEGARIVAERIRAAVEEHGDVTISLGFAYAVPAQDQAASQLIDQADRHLYEAKAAGRNTVRG